MSISKSCLETLSSCHKMCLLLAVILLSLSVRLTSSQVDAACPPGVGKFLTLNGKPYQSKQISVVKAEKIKGSKIAILRVEDNIFYTSPKCSVLEDAKTNFFTNFIAREEYDPYTFSTRKDCVLYLQGDKFRQSKVELTLLLIAEVKPGLSGDCKTVEPTRATFTVEFCDPGDRSCLNQIGDVFTIRPPITSFRTPRVITDEIERRQNPVIETQVVGGGNSDGSTNKSNSELNASKGFSLDDNLMVIMIVVLSVIFVIILLVIIVWCCCCSGREDGLDFGSSLLGSKSKLIEVATQEQINEDRRRQEEKRRKLEQEDWNKRIEKLEQEEAKRKQRLKEQEEEERRKALEMKNNELEQEYKQINESGDVTERALRQGQEHFIIIPGKRRILTVIEEDNYDYDDDQKKYSHRNLPNNLAGLNLAGDDSLNSSYNSRYSRYSYEKQWDNGGQNRLKSHSNSMTSHSTSRSSGSPPHTDRVSMRSLQMQTDAIKDDKNLQTDMDNTQSIDQNYLRRMAAQTTDSIEEEDKEMQTNFMKNANRRYSDSALPSLNDSFASGSLNLTSDTDVSDEEPQPDMIPIKDTKASIMRKRKIRMTHDHIHCHSGKYKQKTSR